MNWFDRPLVGWSFDGLLLMVSVYVTVELPPITWGMPWIACLLRLGPRCYRWFHRRHIRRQHRRECLRRLGYEPISKEILLTTDMGKPFEVSKFLKPFPRSSPTFWPDFDGSKTREQLYRFKEPTRIQIANTHEERVELREYWLLVTRTTAHTHPRHVRCLHTARDVIEWLNRHGYYDDVRKLLAEFDSS